MTIRCDLTRHATNLGDAPGTALRWINGQAHSVPLMQIMDGRSLGSIVQRAQALKEKLMSLGTLLLIVLILMLVGAIPTWPHSKSWGYAPSGVLGLVVVIIIVLPLMGRLYPVLAALRGQPNRDTRHASNTQPHISWSLTIEKDSYEEAFDLQGF